MSSEPDFECIFIDGTIIKVPGNPPPGCAGGRLLLTSRRHDASLKSGIDDPSFKAPIYANLFGDESGDDTLIWMSRPRSKIVDRYRSPTPAPYPGHAPR